MSTFKIVLSFYPKSKTTQIQIQEIPITITWKSVKNINLSLKSLTGEVRISASRRVPVENIRAFVISKLDWIRKNQTKLLSQAKEPQRDFIDNESHFLLGKRYLLKVTSGAKANLTLANSKLDLQIPSNTTKKKRKAIFHSFYRKTLSDVMVTLVPKWKERMKVPEFTVSFRMMKTRWGTCYPSKRKIWLNLELAKKPISCVEYVLVHEMVHLLEASHNKRFVRLMDQFLPNWREIKTELNQSPIQD